jgi:hypothetical protein
MPRGEGQQSTHLGRSPQLRYATVRKIAAAFLGATPPINRGASLIRQSSVVDHGERRQHQRSQAGTSFNGHAAEKITATRSPPQNGMPACRAMPRAARVCSTRCARTREQN